jgi:hypothetical protein
VPLPRVAARELVLGLTLPPYSVWSTVLCGVADPMFSLSSPLVCVATLYALQHCVCAWTHPHTNAHTHTHTHAPAVDTHSRSRVRSLSHTQTHSHALSHTRLPIHATYTPTLTRISLPHTQTGAHALYHTHAPTYAYALYHRLTHPCSLPVRVCCLFTHSRARSLPHTDKRARSLPHTDKRARSPPHTDKHARSLSHTLTYTRVRYLSHTPPCSLPVRCLLFVSLCLMRPPSQT